MSFSKFHAKRNYKLGGEVVFNSKVKKINTDDLNNIISFEDTSGKIYDTSNSCITSTIPIDKISKMFGHDSSLYFRKII